MATMTVEEASARVRETERVIADALKELMAETGMVVSRIDYYLPDVRPINCSSPWMLPLEVKLEVKL